MKWLLFVIMAVSVIGQSLGQVKTKVYTLDLSTPTSNALSASDSSNSKSLVLPNNELLAFRLVNGNPYKYRYVINHKLINFLEGQSYNPIDSVAYFISKDAINKNVDIQSEEQKILENELAIKKKELAELNNVDVTKSNKVNIDVKKVTLKLQIESIEAKINKFTSKSFYSASFISNVKLNNLPKVASAIIAKDEEDDKINIKNASEVLKRAFEDLEIEIAKYIVEISSEDFIDESVFLKKRRYFKELYLERLQNLQGISNEAANFPDVADYFNSNMKDVNIISVKINEEVSKMFQMKLHSYLLPIDINGKNIDVVQIIVERYDKKNTNSTPDKYNYNIWVTGGLKIDVSGGFFVTSLLDREYETQDKIVNVKESEEIHKLIYEKNKGDYDFGFGSMINISLRAAGWVRFALSMGALFTPNQKFQILTGPGLILGKEERIVFTGGWAMGSVSQISDHYKADGNTAYNLGTSGTIPMINKFTSGHFFGITYSFGKVKKYE